MNDTRTDVDFTTLTVVVVDDNQHMRTLLRTMLRAFGVRRIYEAVDGADGLELARDHEPDVMLIDLAMPVLNGFELIEMIRKGSGKNSVALIALTARAERSSVIKAQAAGVDDYLCKPISPRMLFQRMTRAVAAARMGHSTHGRVLGNAGKNNDRDREFDDAGDAAADIEVIL